MGRWIRKLIMHRFRKESINAEANDSGLSAKV